MVTSFTTSVEAAGGKTGASRPPRGPSAMRILLAQFVSLAHKNRRLKLVPVSSENDDKKTLAALVGLAALLIVAAAYPSGQNLMIRSLAGGDQYCRDASRDHRATDGDPVQLFKCHCGRTSAG